MSRGGGRRAQQPLNRGKGMEDAWKSRGTEGGAALGYGLAVALRERPTKSEQDERVGLVLGMS